jgi:hypothetical protein
VSATHSPVLRRVQPVSEAARVSVAVRTAAHMRRGIIAARSYRRLKRYSNWTRYRGTRLRLIARWVPVIAALILPRAVLTYFKAGVWAAVGPEPVLTTWCVHPASATLVKH